MLVVFWTVLHGLMLIVTSGLWLFWIMAAVLVLPRGRCTDYGNLFKEIFLWPMFLGK